MKSINGVPLRRQQGFKGDGANHITLDNNLSAYSGARYSTIAGWVRITDYSQQCIIFKSDVAKDPEYGGGIKLWIGSTGQVRIFTYYNDQSIPIISFFGYTTIASIDTNKLYHIACITDAQTQSSIIYINGVVMATTYTELEPSYFTGTVIFNNLYPPTIGVQEYTTGFDRFLKGSVSQVKLWDIQLTQTQIKEEMYANNIQTIGYWPLQYNTKDYSGNGNNGTVTGTEQYEIVDRGIESINNLKLLTKKGFKGDGASYITTPKTTAYTQFTFMSWVDFTTDTNQVRQMIARKSDTNSGGEEDANAFYIGASISSGDSYFLLQLYNSTGSAAIVSDGDFVSDGVHHCAITIDFNTGNYIGYIDGEILFSGTGASSYIWSTQPWSFMRGNDFFNNKKEVVGEIKMFSSVLTQSQIKEEMKGNVLPSVGYWPLQEDTKDYSQNSNDGTVTGTEQYEVVQNGLTEWKDPVLP